MKYFLHEFPIDYEGMEQEPDPGPDGGRADASRDALAAAIAAAFERAGVFTALEGTRAGVERGLLLVSEEVARLEQGLRREESGAAVADAVRAAARATAADLREGMRREIADSLDAAHRSGRDLAAQARADMREFAEALLKAARDSVDKNYRELEDRLERGLAALSVRLLDSQGRSEALVDELRGSAESTRAAMRSELSELLAGLGREQGSASESLSAELRALVRSEVAGVSKAFAESSARSGDVLQTVQASFAERLERLEAAARDRAEVEAARVERFESAVASLREALAENAAACSAAREAAQAAGPQAAAAASEASERTSKALLELSERVEAFRPILQSIMTTSESARLAATGAQRETIALKDDMRFFSNELASFNSSLGKTLETLGRIRDDVSPAVFGELKEVVGVLSGELDALKARVLTGDQLKDAFGGLAGDLKTLEGAVGASARGEDVRALGAALEGMRGGFDVLGERMDAAWKALRGRDESLLSEAFEPLRDAVVRLQRGLAPLAGELRALTERDEQSLSRAERELRGLSGKFDALSAQLVRLLKESLHGHETLLRDLSARSAQEPPSPPSRPS